MASVHPPAHRGEFSRTELAALLLSSANACGHGRLGGLWDQLGRGRGSRARRRHWVRGAGRGARGAGSAGRLGACRGGGGLACFGAERARGGRGRCVRLAGARGSMGGRLRRDGVVRAHRRKPDRPDRRSRARTQPPLRRARARLELASTAENSQPAASSRSPRLKQAEAG